jgi:hypothetical protein
VHGTQLAVHVGGTRVIISGDLLPKWMPTMHTHARGVTIEL